MLHIFEIGHGNYLQQYSGFILEKTMSRESMAHKVTAKSKQDQSFQAEKINIKHLICVVYIPTP